MKLLDRYIARQYLINVVALTVILFAFMFTIDVSLNFDRFMGVAETRLKESGVADPSSVRKFFVTIYLAADLWWPRMLSLFNLMIGLILVGAMGFTFTQLVRGREMVAVLASGVPLHRAAAPVLAVALGMIGLMAFNQEFVVPRIAPLLTRDPGDAGKRAVASYRVPLCADSTGRLWYARKFDSDTGVIEGLWVWERDQAALAFRRITADSARWRDGGWDLTGGRAETRDADRTAVATVTRIETDLDPATLTMKRFEAFGQSLSLSQLKTMLARPERLTETRRDQLERTRWGRFSIMASNVLALVICVPFFLRREPANMMVQSLKCAPVAITALVGGVLGAMAAIPGLPAPLAVFVPVLVLVPVAVAQITGLRT